MYENGEICLAGMVHLDSLHQSIFRPMSAARIPPAGMPMSFACAGGKHNVNPPIHMFVEERFTEAGPKETPTIFLSASERSSDNRPKSLNN